MIPTLQGCEGPRSGFGEFSHHYSHHHLHRSQRRRRHGQDYPKSTGQHPRAPRTRTSKAPKWGRRRPGPQGASASDKVQGLTESPVPLDPPLPPSGVTTPACVTGGLRTKQGQDEVWKAASALQMAQGPAASGMRCGTEKRQMEAFMLRGSPQPGGTPPECPLLGHLESPSCGRGGQGHAGRGRFCGQLRAEPSAPVTGSHLEDPPS